MVDPLCPHCKTPASKHEDNQCLDAWLDRTKFGANHETLGHTLEKQNDDRHAWFDGKLQLRYVLDFASWAHAGPLLEEMLKDSPTFVRTVNGLSINNRGFEIGPRNTWTWISFFPSFTLAICRAYLIWKANQK